MESSRRRLVSGTYLQGRYQIIAQLPEEDTAETLTYLGIEQQLGFVDKLVLLVEYSPADLCERSNLRLIKPHQEPDTQQQFELGLAAFREGSQKLASGEGEQLLGVLIHTIECNQTAYRIHDWKDYQYRKLLSHVSDYARIPIGYFPPNTDEDNFKIGGIEVDSAPDVFQLKEILGEYDGHSLTALFPGAQQLSLFDLDLALRHERESLMGLLAQLQAFEQSSCDYAMGEKRQQISFDEMDKDSSRSEWYLLRMLIKPDDEFWSWVIPGESAGVCMYRDGRVFRNWVTQIS